jgi:hypothetical protein
VQMAVCSVTMLIACWWSWASWAICLVQTEPMPRTSAYHKKVRRRDRQRAAAAARPSMSEAERDMRSSVLLRDADPSASERLRRFEEVMHVTPPLPQVTPTRGEGRHVASTSHPLMFRGGRRRGWERKCRASILAKMELDEIIRMCAKRKRTVEEDAPRANAPQARTAPPAHVKVTVQLIGSNKCVNLNIPPCTRVSAISRIVALLEGVVAQMEKPESGLGPVSLSMVGPGPRAPGPRATGAKRRAPNGSGGLGPAHWRPAVWRPKKILFGARAPNRIPPFFAKRGNKYSGLE